MSPMPIITLSNGLRVGNLSSGHPFEFVDGSVLPACATDRVLAGKLDIVETIKPRASKAFLWRGINVEMITMQATLSVSAMGLLDDAASESVLGRVDLVIIPLMMQEAIRNDYRETGRAWSPLLRPVVIRKEGRDTTTERAKICIDKFCI